MPEGQQKGDNPDTSIEIIISDEHRAAMAGWKARKEQLYRQRESVDRVNDEAEKVHLLSLSKEKKKPL